MMGRIARGALVGLLFALVVGVWPAHAAVSNVAVTTPSNNQVLQGTYNADGSTAGFKVNLRGTATTNCSGFSSISFRVTGPNSYSKTFPYGSYSGKNFSGGPSTQWDTQALRNGLYQVRIDVTDSGGVLCNSQSGSAYTMPKLANTPQPPMWDGSPTAASDGSASVTLSWKANPEVDVVEYHIFRKGPDGSPDGGKEAIVPASGGGCSFSNGSYTCTDTNFGSSYGGKYEYAIIAMRGRPAYNSGETAVNCTSTNNPCVASGLSDARYVTLAQPTPTPSPTGSPSPGGSPTPGGSGSPTPHGSKGSGLGSGSRGGSSVLSFGTSRSGNGSGFNEFYTGTYSENLPYQPKTLIVGGSGTPSQDGRQVEAASVADAPPNYRTVMLPVAGGLLAFLSAAHVRRLLLHF